MSAQSELCNPVPWHYGRGTVDNADRAFRLSGGRANDQQYGQVVSAASRAVWYSREEVHLAEKSDCRAALRGLIFAAWPSLLSVLVSTEI